MKNKFLLSTLLGSALLAGCTADDALNVNKVAEQVNPNAPVFNVSFNDDASMRGEMTNSMRWLTTDRTSLYHGGGVVSGTGESWTVAKHADSHDFLSSGMIKNFDAIYAQEGEGTEAKFVTKSMVNEGFAIMVYPADTAYAQNGLSPVIELTNEQDENTKNLTPYISEVLAIGEYTKDAANNTAGYGREYDVLLRRIGGQMRIKLNEENKDYLTEAGVGDIEYRKVTIEVNDDANSGNVKPFTTKSVIKIGQPRVQEGEATPEGAEEVGNNPEDGSYDHWAYTPWIEPVDKETTGPTKDIEASNFISTTDLKTAEGHALFTLLPYDDRKDYCAVFDEEGNAKFTTVKITVDTYYGRIEIEEPEEEGETVWTDNSGHDLTLVDGLSAILKSLFDTPAKTEKDLYPLYKNQIIGRNRLANLKVDLSKLDMDGLHITSSEQLVKVLSLYNALKEEQKEEVTFYLDGGKDGNPEGKFVMTPAAWDATKKVLEAQDEEHKVKFVACNVEGEECMVIVLDNSGNPEAEVPSLTFTKESAVAGGTGVNVTLELVGDWSFSGRENKAVDGVNLSKTFGGIVGIVVKDGSVLTLKPFEGSADGKGYVIAQTGIKGAGIEVEHGATVNVDGDIYVGVKLWNKGTINIPSGKFLTVYGTNTTSYTYDLINEAATDEEADGWSDADGVINVAGTLSVAEGATAKIKNYGLIKQQGSNANIQITENEEGTNTIKTLFNNGVNIENVTTKNRIGTILLDNTLETANNDVKVSGNQGFIVLDVNKATPAAADFGTKANYARLGSACTTLNAAALSNKNIQYVEFNTTGKVTMTGDFTYATGNNVQPGTGSNTLKALLVKAGCQVVLNDAGYLKVSDYMYVHEAGAKFTYPKGQFSSGSSTASYQVTGYFGGTEDDKKNITYSGAN